VTSRLGMRKSLTFFYSVPVVYLCASRVGTQLKSETHCPGDASSRGRIVQGTHRPGDALSRGRIVQGTHRPGDESSRGRIVQGRIFQGTHRPGDASSMDASSKNFSSGDTLVGDKSSWPQYFLLHWEMAIALVFLKK
jgi:hypothetical protein